MRSRGDTTGVGARRTGSWASIRRATKRAIRALRLRKAWNSRPRQIEVRSSSSSIGPAAFFAQRSSSFSGTALRQAKPAAIMIANSAPPPNSTAVAIKCTPVSGPNKNAGRRNSASPITPPRPVGSGHFGLFGRQDAKPEASEVPASQNSRRCHSRSKSRCVAIRQPQMATGSTSTVDARPSSCINRSLPIAPGAPSRLRTGASVAWLNEGSCTDQVASAHPIVTASVIKAMPPHSRMRRRIMPRRSSVQSERSKVRSLAAMTYSDLSMI